jgi:thiamine biosynthesis lipoprotein
MTPSKKFSLSVKGDVSKITFNAMASPCEILIYTKDRYLPEQIAHISTSEIYRIETKYSRYQSHNLCSKMNQSHGKKVSIDHETFLLLEYAKQLYQLSHGLFDITSGSLRRLWHFIEGSTPPSKKAIKKILPLIGFNKIHYSTKSFLMPALMEIDLGGIGKEYAVDKVSQLISLRCKQTKSSFLINLGGDLSAASFNSDHPSWRVGLESLNDKNNKIMVELKQGAIATSGNTQRFFYYQGKKYSHILNPKTGKPIDGAPQLISVFAKTCTLAGGMSTIAQLQGKEAENFLIDNSIRYICSW